jgi:ABC-type branched-subunit amino acid transport system permease subunit
MFGYAGTVSFGAAAYYAVGAYTTALLLTNTGVPFFLEVVAKPHRHFFNVTMTQASWKKATNILI